MSSVHEKGAILGVRDALELAEDFAEYYTFVEERDGVYSVLYWPEGEDSQEVGKLVLRFEEAA